MTAMPTQERPAHDELTVEGLVTLGTSLCVGRSHLLSS